METSLKFIGPIEPKPTIMDVIAATTSVPSMESSSKLNNDEKVHLHIEENKIKEVNEPATNVKSDSTQVSTESTTPTAKVNVASPISVAEIKKSQVFSSSWDKPGHIGLLQLATFLNQFKLFQFIFYSSST